MRREYDDAKGQGDACRDRESGGGATGSDEFVDILQVQQLLLDGPSSSVYRSRGRARDQYQAPSPNTSRGRLLDALVTPASSSSYYLTGYSAHQQTPNVDDLVALWFAGNTSSGVC